MKPLVCESNNQCPIWTPLYWHRRFLGEHVANAARRMIDWAKDQFPSQKIEILDVGCGTMPYRKHFAYEGVRYVGADIPWAASQAEIAIDPATESIMAGDASFHGLVHFQVMEHVPHFRKFLTECHRVLKPGGIMFFTVPFAFEFHGVPSDYRRWTREGLKVDLEDAGFAVHTVTPVEGDFISVLTIAELYLANRCGYRLTKPLFLGLNCLGFLAKNGRSGLIPLTNSVFCVRR
jgi:SAM-dependent methyltransferase